MRTFFTFCACAALALTAGCAGYQLGPTNGLSAGARSIQVSPLVNKTSEPRLGDYVMHSLRKSLQLDGTYRLASHDDGDIVVSGVLQAYRRSELSYVPSDVITVLDYDIYLTMQLTARERSTGRVLMTHEVTGHTSLRAGNDLPSAERQAIPLLAEDLARKATAMLVDGSW